MATVFNAHSAKELIARFGVDGAPSTRVAVRGVFKAVVKLAVPALSLALAFSHYRLYEA